MSRDGRHIKLFYQGKEDAGLVAKLSRHVSGTLSKKHVCNVTSVPHIRDFIPDKGFANRAKEGGQNTSMRDRSIRVKTDGESGAR